MQTIEEQIQNIEVIDGYRIDVDSGEIIGIADERPEFTVHDEDSCNWVMGKLLDAEASIAAVETSEEVIRAKAVLANAAAMSKERMKRLEWLHKRFDPELGEYARKQLEGAKTKTLKTLLGSISLRIKKGGLRVKDASKALGFAKSNGWDCCIKRTEEFRISGMAELTQEVMDEIMNDLDFRSETYNLAVRDAFMVEPDSETTSVKTGVSA